MGVGTNPTTWFVAVASLLLARTLIDFGKETAMKTSNRCRKALVKSRLTIAVLAFGEPFWAIATNVVAWFVTLSIHQKGAPGLG